MSAKNDPVSPIQCSHHCSHIHAIKDPGLTAVEYAAIALKVPRSGTDWLDEMIKEANLLKFAGIALQALRASDYRHDKDHASDAYSLAEAMLSEAEKRKENVS